MDKRTNNIEERVLRIANFIIESGITIREAANLFGYSKSTVHKDITERLPQISYNTYEKVDKILQSNKNERHIRGGFATKVKWMNS